MNDRPDAGERPDAPRAGPALRLRTAPAGLVLTGGGARAAYQIGVLKGVSDLLHEFIATLPGRHVLARNPFPILVGTSAGAINAAGLASRAQDFRAAVADLVDVWSSFRAADVYQADTFGVVRTGARWLSLLSIGWMLRRVRKTRPRSLLDNAPLHDLLRRVVDLSRIEDALLDGDLTALAVTASSYASGRHITFFQSLFDDYPMPVKMQRVTYRTAITHEHLLASSAIPFVFPAQTLSLPDGIEYCGDGSMRQISPISPAIYLGAQRVLVIGAGQIGRPGMLGNFDRDAYPSIAQIAGHAMASIFLDALASDIERLEKMNWIAAGLTSEQRHVFNLRRVESLVIAPSQRIDGIAAEHTDALPRPVRALLEVLGARGPNGAALASYLLFEAPFTRALIDLGEADARARRDAVLSFFFEPVGTPAGFALG